MGEKSADVIIIGGGIVGCATAYRLAKRGVSVIVLEKKEIGNGGSCRNAGGVRQSGRDPREIPLAMYAIEHIWPTLSDELSADVEYVKKGNLRLGKSEAHRKILENLTKNANKCGLDMRMIEGDEVRKINPYLSDEVTCAGWCPTDGHANPLKTTLAYYMAGRRLGVKYYTGEKVKELKKEKGKIRYVLTGSETYQAEKVIVACGYESREILDSVGIDIPMTKLLIEALVTEAEPEMFPQMLGTADADFYGHQTGHGSFVFGGSSGLERYNKDNGTPVNSSKTAPCICRGIMKYFPDLADAKIVRTWAGWMDASSDGVPSLGTIDEIPGLYVACAFNGHGFGIAPAVGEQLAKLIVTGKTDIDLSELHYDRYKAKI